MPYCPICRLEIRTRANLCPHVALVVAPDDLYGDLYVRGYRRLRVSTDVLEAPRTITFLGNLPDGSEVWWSPSPGVYYEAVLMSLATGTPVSVVYPSLWHELGMEEAGE